jgi:hypothetical protein
MLLRTIILAVIVSGGSAATAAADQIPAAPPPAPRPIALVDQQPAPAPPAVQPGPRTLLKPPAGPPTPMAQPPAEAPSPGPARKLRGRDANLQIEITISDQPGGEAPQKKVVSMLVADQTMGRIRASANAAQKVGFVGTGLNVDARPVMLEGDRILLELTVEYTPHREGGQVTQSPTVLNESLSVILQSGKPMVVSQAADPVTDRKMTLEVRATVA